MLIPKRSHPRTGPVKPFAFAAVPIALLPCSRCAARRAAAPAAMRLGCWPMSDLRSVLLLCWRDTGHPQGGGSEAYLQRVGAQLAASGIAVTLRTARYPGAPRRDVIDGVRISRAGGRYSVYFWAFVTMAAAR